MSSLPTLAEDVLRLAATRDPRVVSRAIELADRVIDEASTSAKKTRKDGAG